MFESGSKREETLESVMGRIEKKGQPGSALKIPKILKILLSGGNTAPTIPICSGIGSASYDAVADNIGRLGEWIRIYRNYLGYLGDEHDINQEHVESVCKMELAEEDLAHRISDSCEGTPELGGFEELDGAVRRQLEKELNRIRKELDRREHILEEEVRRKDYSPGREGQRDNLELLLAATDELFRMKKMVCGEAGNMVVLRSELETRLKQCLGNHGERGKDDKSFGIILQEDPYSDGPSDNDTRSNDNSRNYDRSRTKSNMKGQMPDYSLIARNASNHLTSLGSQLEEDVLGVEGIREVFAARDSYYVSLSLIGMPTPVAEIEKAVSNLYSRDKRRIEVFAKKNGKGNANTEIVRRAKHYAEVLDAWESLGA